MRLDQYIMTKYSLDSRNKAQQAIKDGRVSVNSITIKKTGFCVDESDNIVFLPAKDGFISRAGEKLSDALNSFAINVMDRVCLDVGASTGGFSEVLLANTARLIYALDVGSDQLHHSIKSNPKVIDMQKCNARYISKAMFQEKITFCCIDISFISIKKVLPAVLNVMDTKELVILIKPQFEVGRSNLKKGIVKESRIHIRLLYDMIEYMNSLDLKVLHVKQSCILGKDGNKEFIMHVQPQENQRDFPIQAIVNNEK